jgi:hypothetical protein
MTVYNRMKFVSPPPPACDEQVGWWGQTDVCNIIDLTVHIPCNVHTDCLVFPCDSVRVEKENSNIIRLFVCHHNR